METLSDEERQTKALAVRRKLRDDFKFYASRALWLRTKSAQIVPFDFNVAQRYLDRRVEEQYANEGLVRAIILKGRQMGISTYVGGKLYARTSQRKGIKTLVMTHKSDSTNALFTMTKRYHANVPEQLKASTKYSSKKELVFDVLDSSYIVATAGAESVARGETIQLAHLSEMAFWKKSSAQDIYNGLEQAIPNEPDTEVYIESTANGVSGVFYDLWQGAVEGKNGYIPIFLPWYWMPEYKRKVPEDFTRTPDEEELVKQFGLTDGQLQFRRNKISNNGLDLFKQEYPMTPEEAFLTSGRPVFNPEDITARMKIVKGKPILAQKALEGKEFHSNPRGELKCYYEHDPGDTYYIGADIAMGVRGGDYSVAQVFDSKKRQVAVWRGHTHPDTFAEILSALGHLYNQAMIIPENNNHGILTCSRLAKDLMYPNVFIEEVVDKVTEEITEKLGFTTTVKTKPLIIDELRGAMRSGEVELNDMETLKEMLTYIVTDSGKMEAEEGAHDDCVMSLALMNHIHEGYFEPIANVDEWYVEMI